jgi:hypothetical protein
LRFRLYRPRAWSRCICPIDGCPKSVSVTQAG